MKVKFKKEYPDAIIPDKDTSQSACVNLYAYIIDPKHRGEGIGTSSIRQIALQYRGKADFNWQDGVFRAAVFLNPQAN